MKSDRRLIKIEEFWPFVQRAAMAAPRSRARQLAPGAMRYDIRKKTGSFPVRRVALQESGHSPVNRKRQPEK